MTVAAAVAQEFSLSLEAARSADGVLEDTDGIRWVVELHSHSYSNDGPRGFTVNIREHERLQAERLELLDFSLTPLYYDKIVTPEGVLSILAEVEPEGAAANRLEELLARRSQDQEYFEVLRVGVHNRPVEARWGRCLWQHTTEGRRRHSIVLVTRPLEQEHPSLSAVINQPALDNTSRIALYGRELVEALVDELERRGALDVTATVAIRSRAATAGERRFRDLEQSDDVTRYR